VWRTLSGLTAARLGRVAKARARVRRRVWSLLPGGLPASTVADTDLGEVVVLDVDATIVVAHSDKERAGPTFKGTFGFHPIGVWCDNTTEMLAAALRCGRDGSNTASDHIAVLTAAITQIPRSHRGHLLVRTDGAGYSHKLVKWHTEQNNLRGRRMDYSLGYPITEAVRQAIMLVPEKVWTPAVDADGGVRAGGDVAELTGLLDLSAWPQGMRVIARRERPHPGAQLSVFEERDGWRYQAFITNTATGQLAFLEARHRAHARVEDRIRHAKRLGSGPVSVTGVRDQSSLVVGGDDRGRSDRLAAAACPVRVVGQSRTQSNALPDTAHPGPADPQRTTKSVAATRFLALDR